MLWIIAMVDKPLEAKTTVVRRNPVSDVDTRAETLKGEGMGSEAAELLRSYYGGTVIDARLMEELGKAKDEVYEQRRRPFSPPTSDKPLWESSDGYLAASSLDEKYFDVVKDPRSDTLFAAVVRPDSVVLYKGVVDYVGRTVSWSRWTTYVYSGDLRNPDLAVDGNYVYVAFSKAYSATDHDPRLLKVKRSDTTKYLYYISLAGDFEDFPTVTTDYEQYTSVYVYYAYWNANKDSVMFARVSNPDTTTFTSYGGIAYAVGDTSTVNRLSIDYFYSNGSKLFLAYMTNGDTVLLADGSPFGSSWTERSASFGKGLFPHIKGKVGGPYLAVVYTYPYSSTDYDCKLQYSTDTGSTFSSYNCGFSLDDELWPTVAFAADTVWVTMLRGDKETPVDSVTDTMYVMISAHPITGGTWIYRDSINDPNYKYGVLTTWHPVITGPEDTLASKQFLHVAWARRFGNTSDFDVRMDYHFFDVSTATEEAPSTPTGSDVVVVKGGLKLKGSYHIYDLSGRLVDHGYAEDGRFVRLKEGSYFVRTSSGVRTVIVR